MKGEQYLESLALQKEAMAERVIQWSNINTHSFNIPGLKQMSAVLSQAFSVLNCEEDLLSLAPIDRVDMMGISQKTEVGPLVRFWKRPQAPIQILLVGHMDTVYPLDHPFQIAFRKTEQVIQGPGVADMKGGLCVLLEALKIFENSPGIDQLGWEVLINSDEELGSLGSARFLEERAKVHHLGLVFEPAMDEFGTLAAERKGSGKFTVIVRGRAAHVGRDFSAGRNAISCLAEIILQIDALNGVRSGVVLNVGQVQGGSAVNVVPAWALCQIDLRISTLEDAVWVRDQLDAIIASANRKEGFRAEIEGTFTRKPKIFDPKTRSLYDLLAKVGQELGQSITWKPSGGCCDGNNLTAVGLANIDTLGVCGGKIHSEEEYLLVDSLVSRAKLTAALLLRLSEDNCLN